MIEAITRPTFESETPLPPGQQSPREKYGFCYAEGIPEAIADGVLALRSANQDSVLPLVQVICTQLYERAKTLPGSDGLITREDLDAIKGVVGVLRAFAEDALVRSMRLGAENRNAFKALFIQLYQRQPDGTLTTWMKSLEKLEGEWHRPTPFTGVLEAAKSVRLLREDELRIEGGEPRRYVRLGHDALAKVADAWKAEIEKKQQAKSQNIKLASVVSVALGLFLVASLFWVQKSELQDKNQQLRVQKSELQDKNQQLQELRYREGLRAYVSEFAPAGRHSTSRTGR